METVARKDSDSEGVCTPDEDEEKVEESLSRIGKQYLQGGASEMGEIKGKQTFSTREDAEERINKELVADAISNLTGSLKQESMQHN
mmetsp:Transcript_19949/g.14656  ORF Transcript_19949/g.14656 Transcript_19949/m.14656 type:complete len:87 (-) Transcript_19949:465-725(-)